MNHPGYDDWLLSQWEQQAEIDRLYEHLQDNALGSTMCYPQFLRPAWERWVFDNDAFIYDRSFNPTHAGIHIDYMPTNFLYHLYEQGSLWPLVRTQLWLTSLRKPIPDEIRDEIETALSETLFTKQTIGILCHTLVNQFRILVQP